MKCLILGGAGFIGSHLAQGLLAEGHQVRIFDRPNLLLPAELRADPRILAESAFALHLDAGIIAPPCPLSTREGTRSAAPSVMEYFVVSSGVAVAATPAELVPGWPGNPHRPFAVCLTAHYHELFALRFCTRPSLPH